MAAERQIERYLDAIAPLLPAARRDDIRAELSGLFDDELRAALAAGEDPGQAAETLIARFGAPEKVAARYGSGRVPRTPFQRAMIRVGILLVAIHCLVFSLRAVTIFDRGAGMGQLAISLGAAGLMLVGNVLISLGVLLLGARFAAWLQSRHGSASKRPSAARLYDDVYGQGASRVGLMISLLLLTGGAAVLALAPREASKVLAVAAAGGDTAAVGDTFLSYRPWLIAIMLGWLAMTAALIVRPAQRRRMIWPALVLKLLTIGFFVRVTVAGPTSGGWLFSPSIKIVLLMGLAVSTGMVATQIIELLRGGRGRSVASRR